jgi:hypothetical protein
VNRLALLCAIGALTLAAAPLAAATRVGVGNDTPTQWFRCAFSGSCIPHIAAQRKQVQAKKKPAETPPTVTTQPWIVNK